MKLRCSRPLTVALLGVVFASLALGGAAASSDGDENGVVEIRKANELRPETVRIAAGTTVTWVNKDGSAHRVRGDGGTFDSGTLVKDQRLSLRFDQAGTYAYSLGTISGASWSWWSGGRVEVDGVTAAPTIAPSSAPAPAAPAPAPPTGASVSIFDNSFSPASLTVPAGTTVVWTNRGGSKHTVTAAGTFDSGILSPGATFSFTFTSAGTYGYVCELHGGMSGSVAVTGDATAPTPTQTLVQAPTAPLPLAPPPGGAMVHIMDNSFSPATLSVAVGTTVTWMQMGSVKHTVTSAWFDSGILSVGATFSYTFTSPGTYAYRCDLHSGMTGAIVVTGGAPGAVAPAPTPAPGPTPTPLRAGVPRGALSIVIGDNVFDPGTTRVAAGTTVSWVNHGRVRHTVTSASSVFDSGILSPEGVYSVTFDTPGTYPYVCDIHPGMKGTIEVYGPDGAAPPASRVSAPVPATPGAAPGVAPSTAHVVIGDNSFDAQTIRIAVGTEVSWMNHGVAKHTVTFTDGGVSSPLLSTGQSWSRTFTQTGTYRYICALHPGMTGTIVVTEAAAGASTAATGSASSVSPAPTPPPATRSDSNSALDWQGGMFLGIALAMMATLAIGGPAALALRHSN